MGNIKSKLIKTQNIENTINEFAQINFLDVSKCDFTLKKVETLIRDRSNSEFTLVNEDIKTNYDKEKILNEHVEFSQAYTINIFEKDSPKIDLIHKLAFDNFSTKAFIIISAKSIIPYKEHTPKELLLILYKELNKIKAKNKILLNLFDELMVSNLKTLVKYIYAKKFLKAVKIPLFTGIEPEVTQESKLIFKFLQKDEKKQIIEVEENELLIEFYKPKFGKHGFDCYGKEVGVGYANNKNDLEQEIDTDTIRIEENENKKLYISKIKGYIKLTEKSLKIDNKIKMDKLSRVQNSLASEEDNNIEVIISQYDTTKDSIGEGVELVSASVNIDGHVGANSIIEAQNLNIAGATHQDSTQFSKFANINRHKGTLRCHEAKIKLLEGGEIHATKVDIETCLGGVIYAQDVNITHVKSNLKVFASNSINIKLISGEDNRFKINYKDIPILMSKIGLINEDIDDLYFSLEEAQRHNSSMVYEIQKEINSLKSEIKAIKNSALNAKISIAEPLHGLNTIIFTLSDEHEITFKTEATTYSPFYLEINDETITLKPTNTTIKLNS